MMMMTTMATKTTTTITTTTTTTTTTTLVMTMLHQRDTDSHHPLHEFSKKMKNLIVLDWIQTYIIYAITISPMFADFRGKGVFEQRLPKTHARANQ